MAKEAEPSEMMKAGIERYRKLHNDTILEGRVLIDLKLENEAGKDCAEFQIHMRCATAHRRNRIYH
jgi:hypothetical protein